MRDEVKIELRENLRGVVIARGDSKPITTKLVHSLTA
ncbi:hypothetical protein ACVWW1_003555 [Bradyrhizobium sp. JR3.5]